jgi:hypothetical protein
MPGRVCTICTHAQRDAIEAAIVAGTSYRVISRQFGVSHDAVQRHAISHIALHIQQSQKAKEEVAALDIAQQLQVINSVSLIILQEARSASEQLQQAQKEKAEEQENQLDMVEQAKILNSTQMLALQAIDRVYKQLDLQMRLSLIPPVEKETREDGLFLQLDQLSDQARAKIRLVLVEDEKRRAS